MDGNVVLRPEVGALTDVGCERANNEDCFGYDVDAGIFVVCDGMGGMAAGETASGAAVSSLLECFRQTPSDRPATERLHASIIDANKQVYQLAQSDKNLHGMGTTMVAAFVDGSRVVIGNVGDSRAYFLHGGVCEQMTLDHSFVAEQVRLGRLNAEDADSSPYRSLITRAVGTAADVEPDIFTSALEPGDMLLLTSDGMTRYADGPAIAAILQASASVAEACQRLIDRAKGQGAVDNVTCLLIRFDEAEAAGGM
jgi:PPM family protein phosphatase